MLKERINILKEANVINDSVSNYVNKVIDELEPLFSEKQSGLEMFTTHLAMATQRILTKEEVEDLDDVIWKDVMVSLHYEQAMKLFEVIKEYAPCEYPHGEEKFLIMHLCNLYQ